MLCYEGTCLLEKCGSDKCHVGTHCYEVNCQEYKFKKYNKFNSVNTTINWFFFSYFFAFWKGIIYLYMSKYL